MSSSERYLNCDRKPSEVTDSFWLYEEKEEIAQNYPLADGKWMQFYHKSQLDTMWDFAKAKYRAGSLEGIHSMKVSTACDRSRANSSSDGVIIFYCGPSEDEAKMMQFGQKLLEVIPYKDSSGSMCYKSDEQTLVGTSATAQKQNNLYTLQCQKK